MTAPKFRDDLVALRGLFPPPFPDAAIDESFLEHLERTVRAALALRGPTAQLRATPDPCPASPAMPARLASESTAPREVLDELVELLGGLPLEGHPRGQVNVNAQPSGVSLIAALLPALFNPNLSSDGRGAECSRTEVRLVEMLASLVGMDAARAGGVFTFGGTGTLLYGMKLGLENALPGALRRGVQGDVAVLASQRCHHTVLTAAGWLGIGSDHVRRVPVGADHGVDIEALRAEARAVCAAGTRLAALIATVGTTDAFGLDDVAAIAEMRDELVAEFQLDYVPHLHADAVIGWAWSVFDDYPLDENPLEFSPTVLAGLATARPRIAGLARADSLGIDFHKTAFVPYISSLFLARERAALERLAREPQCMPYLFQTGNYHPGRFTLETTRAAGGVMAAWANLRWLGKAGLRVLLGHALELTAHLRANLESLPGVVIVNAANVGPVTLYRVYPPGVAADDTWHREQFDPAAGALVQQHNDFVQRIHATALARTSSENSACLGLTREATRAACGLPVAALKSYLLSPWLESGDVAAIVHQLVAARQALT